MATRVSCLLMNALIVTVYAQLLSFYSGNHVLVILGYSLRIGQSWGIKLFKLG